MIKKVSIQDIADRLGVSKTLVSLVINGKSKEYRIGEEISRKVIEMAEELGYRPNQIAKWFRTGKTQTLGLLIADISNPFFGRLGREIEREASRLGFRIVLCSSDEKQEKFENQLEMLLESQVDGFIISPPCGGNQKIEMLTKAKIPYVLIDRYFPEIDSNYVITNNFKAARQATSHLLKKGHKRIALLTVNDDLITMHDRTEGYLYALKDAKIEPCNELIYKLPFTHKKKEIRQAIQNLTLPENKVEAVFFASSKIGITGIEVINDMDLKIPGDIAIVSFDDPDYYKICFSPISAISQPLTKMGKTAVQIVAEEIKTGQAHSPSRKIVLNSKFIVRKSSG